MPELLALDLPPGPTFVEALCSAWEAGNAVLPIDPRLPGPAVLRLIEALQPARVVSAEGIRALPGGGVPTEDGDALVVATSGTTGEPKGVVLTSEAVHASAVATSERLSVDPQGDLWLACLPFAHIGGLSVLTRALVTGTPYRIHERFEAAAVEYEACAGATMVSLVATALGRTDTSSYRVVLLGGAAPPSGLPDNVVTTYGMTETGSGLVYDGIPIEGAEVRVSDGSGGPGFLGGSGGSGGSGGEILVRGPMLLRAYRDGHDPKLDGGWLPTGDAGSLGPDGRLVVHGRMAEVIVTGGEKVWPVAVERVLGAQPGVAGVAVWKRPDAEWGERVVAWVVAADPSAPPATGELREAVASELAPWAAPKDFVLVTELPQTSSGKVRRTDLA
jgi:O-succinylbenzoic acid--CoA ligase